MCSFILDFVYYFVTKLKLVLTSWHGLCSIYALPLCFSWLLCSLEGHLSGRGRAESAAPHPQWCLGGMLAQRALASWARDEKLRGWDVVGGQGLWSWSRSCDFCDSILWMDLMDLYLLCVCVQMYLMYVSLCPCRNVAIHKTALSQGYTIPAWIEPLLPAASNKHTHIASTPWGAAGASSGGL